MLRVVSGLPMDGRGERLLEEARVAAAASGLPPRRPHPARAASSFARSRLRPAAAGSAPRSRRLSDLVRALAGRRTHLRAALGRGPRARSSSTTSRAHEARRRSRCGARARRRGSAGSSRGSSRATSSASSARSRRFRSLDRDDPGTREALRLFGLYQTRLVELGLYDDDGLYLEVARDLGTPELPFDRVQPRRRRLVVEGFYQTNVVERAVFEKLFAAFDETLWLVDAPEPAGGVRPLGARGD